MAAHSLPLNLLCLSEQQVMALPGARALEVSACPPLGSWPNLQGQSSRPGHQCLSQLPSEVPKFLPTCEILGCTGLSYWHVVGNTCLRGGGTWGRLTGSNILPFITMKLFCSLNSSSCSLFILIMSHLS